jgi:hypothetical protein
MPFPWVALAISAAFTFLGALLTPRKKSKDAGLNAFDVPTATEDRPKPVWVGTVRHKSANCIWYGDYSAKPIKNKVGILGIIASLGSALLSRQVIGYSYFLGIQLCLGWGELDAITRIALNDKEAWTGSIKDGSITINKPTLFGSADEVGGTGGFQATVVVYPGDGTQDADPYVVAKSGASPAYKRDILMVFKGLTTGGAYVGDQASFPNIEIDARRCPNQLAVTGDKHIIDTHDANPVCALYELMTRERNEFGGGYSPAQFDLDNWREAAETVYTEGLGISRMFDSNGDVEGIIEDYLNLIDAVININMTTGKFELALARFDYDPETIIEIGEDDVIEVLSYKHGTWIETSNEAKLSFIDRTDNFVSKPIAAQDGANSSGQAEVRSITTSIEGISNPTVANKMIWRELKVISTPLATIKLKLTRRGFDMRGGGVFKWVGGARYGVTSMIFRITEIDPGTVSSNAVEVSGIQDIFAIGSTAYNPPIGTGWTPPVTTASNITVEDIYEQPYLFHQTDATKAFTVAAPANTAQLSYDLYTHEGALAYVERLSSIPFTPTGVLNGDYASVAYDTAGSLVVTAGFGMDDLPDTVTPAEIVAGTSGLLMINGEILAYESYTIVGDDYIFDGVWGGLLDTILNYHTDGDRVWFISEGIGLDPTIYTDGATVSAKLASIGSAGAVPLASCTEITL